MAALTIFMAAVICLVLLTDVIRLRTSFRLGISGRVCGCLWQVYPVGRRYGCFTINYRGS